MEIEGDRDTIVLKFPNDILLVPFESYGSIFNMINMDLIE